MNMRERITQYAKDKLNTDAEFLWENIPSAAAFRHLSNEKWFAVMMTVKAGRLGIPAEWEPDGTAVYGDDGSGFSRKADQNPESSEAESEEFDSLADAADYARARQRIFGSPQGYTQIGPADPEEEDEFGSESAASEHDPYWGLRSLACDPGDDRRTGCNMTCDPDSWSEYHPARDPERPVDILDVKLDPLMVDNLRGRRGYLPAYHMNKKYWLTILLDGTVPEEEIIGLLNTSYDHTLSKQKKTGVLANCHDWLVPANPKYYDVETAFQKNEIILWKQSTNISVGDTVYMYEGAPWSCLRFHCQAVEVDIPYKKKGGQVKISKAMRIRRIETYPPDYMPLSRLREEYDVYSVRGPRSTPPALLQELRAHAAAVTRGGQSPDPKREQGTVPIS